MGVNLGWRPGPWRMPNMNLWICTLTIAYKITGFGATNINKLHHASWSWKNTMKRIIKDLQMMVEYMVVMISMIFMVFLAFSILAAESPPQMPKAKKNPSTKIININTECFRIFQTYLRFILKHSGSSTNLTWVGGLNLGLWTGEKTGDVRHQTTGQLQYEAIIANNLLLKFIEDHFRHFLQNIKIIQDICTCKDMGGIVNDN